MPITVQRTFNLTSTKLVLGACILSALAGCGAQIRPDGPKRVVFTESDGSQRVYQASASTELRKLAIDRLMLMSSDPSPELRANAIEALASVQSQVEPIVALSLSDPNPGVRAVAAMVAGQSRLSPLTPTIQGLLNDESAIVRSAALYALGSFGEEVDLTELSIQLFEDPSSGVRSQAAYILGELNDLSALPMLEQAVIMPNPNASVIQLKLFRLQVAEAMIKLGSSKSIDTIRAALYPSRPEELEATALAVQIIGQIKDDASIDQLIYLADSEAENPMPAEVRLGVAYALAKMGHREGSFVADEYIDSQIDAIRAQCAAVYGQTRNRGNLGKLEMLMLNDPSPLTQVAAAGAIVDYTQQEQAQSSAQERKSGH